MAIYKLMFVGGLILGIAFLIATIVIFFVLKVGKAFGIVTGRTQKKAIEEIRAGGTAKVGKRGAGGTIKAHEVKASTASGSLIKGRKGRTSEQLKPLPPKMSDEEAKRAAHEAARAAAHSSDLQLQKNGKLNLDEEATEVLTYKEMKEGQQKGDSTEILSGSYEGESTDVLSNDNSHSTAKRQNTVGEEATDVLSNEDDDEFDPSEEETTDVLKSREGEAGEAATAVLENEDEDEEDDNVSTTDVLTSKASSIGTSDVHGKMDLNSTSVLIAGMAPESGKKDIGEKLTKVQFLYSETVTHTDETL